MIKQLVAMNKISSISSIPKDTIIIFENEDEVESFISLYEDEGGQSCEATVECLTHFTWSLDSIQGATLCFSTWSMNHGDLGYGENICCFEENGKIIGDTVVDTEAQGWR